MKQDTGLKRNSIDKYYTKKDVVVKCIDMIKSNINVGENDLCIEPSAGNGSFISGIKQICTKHIFYDLEPEGKEIIKQDYLLLDVTSFQSYDKIHVIGNPPFGRQSSLAIKFIKKSVNFSDTISFILPKSFKKDSMQKHFPPNFHLVCNQDLPNDSFLVDDESYNVPCVFQIWEKRNTNRILPKKLKPNNFTFVKKDESPDISFRRVGINAGKIDRDTKSKAEQSHYFIKFQNRIGKTKLEKLNSLMYDTKDNTVGPRSISKPELIKEFNKIL